ncbi:hypothetical protein KV395_13275 [Microbacterium luteolum]|uniref:Asp23/Gls24 family envelope stress response protein n=2 Tax=Microbacterium luteolum TaxID=69367 RepID=A0ABY7XTS7_MICLT|nr:hypothetical protein KV395_13275 [Microbacterium luteolum]
MTPEARTELAQEIEDAVRATPGVRNVYRSGSLVSNLLRAGAVALGVSDDSRPIISVVAGEEGLAVEASVGVDVAASAAVVLLAAYEAVDAVLRTAGLHRESITLTVVYVQSRDAA